MKKDHLKAFKNPLERHTCRGVLSLDSMTVAVDGLVLKRDLFVYKFFNYRNWRLENRRWICISVLEKTERWEKLGNLKGLLKVDNSFVCLSCLTSEYVVSRQELNGGTPTCLRCSRIFKGLE